MARPIAAYNDGVVISGFRHITYCVGRLAGNTILSGLMKSIFDNSRRYAVAMYLNTISAFRLGRLLKKYVILLVTLLGSINRKQTVLAVVIRSDHNSYVVIEKKQMY